MQFNAPNMINMTLIKTILINIIRALAKKPACAVVASAAIMAGAQTTAANPQPLIPTFKVSYTLENKYITGGKAEFRLEHSGENGYQLVLETQPTGVFRFSDKGKIREVAHLDNLSPPFLADKYSYTNYGDSKRSYSSLYDRSKGEATVTRGDTSKQVAINPEAVDRLSTTLFVMQQLMEQPAIDEFSVQVIDPDGTRTMNFIAKGQSSLKTKIGKFDAMRIDRLRANSKRHTVTWFARLGADKLPVPVQIEQYKRGKLTVRLKITRFAIIE